MRAIKCSIGTFSNLTGKMGRLSGFHDLFFLALWLSGGAQSAVLEVDKTRLEMGEAGLKEMEGNAAHSPCWSAAVEKLDLSCKQLSDMEQSKLSVAFANCHLAKSGRSTYPCTEEMSVRDCTESMDSEAYQTYTHFFTHTGHICYFLQIELWQGRTEGLIGRLSHTSTEALSKLELSLKYHEAMSDKQDTALNNQDKILDQDRQIAASLHKTHVDMEASFGEMTVMAEQQKAMLGEMFGSLQGSVEAVHGLMSLLVVEFVGWGTVAWFCLAWLVVMLLPQFHYSRFKLLVVLVGEGMVEVCLRKLYGYLVIAGDSPPSDLSVLYNMLWVCRYLCGGVCLLLYVWEWYNYQDYGERNYRLLAEIRQLLRNGTSSSVQSPHHSATVQPKISRKTPIPLPYTPLTTQPPPPPPPLHLEEFADTPDSTQSTPHYPHQEHRSHPPSSHFVLSSDDEEYSIPPDNDRAAASVTKRNTPLSVRVQRTSKPKAVKSGAEPLPSSSSRLLTTTSTGHLSSDEDTPDNNSDHPQPLTRSPIRCTTSNKSPLSTVENRTMYASSSGSRGKRTGGASSSGSRGKRTGGASSSGSRGKRTGGASRWAATSSAVRGKPGSTTTSDPEPEKEVTEEKDAPVSGGGGEGRQSLRSTDIHHQTRSATPTPPSPLPPPASSGPTKPHLRARSSTPVPTNTRYFLRDRTPKPLK